MPKECYAKTQVREVTLTKNEILQIVLENIVHRCSLNSYDFDYQQPYVVNLDNGGLSFRFIQKNITREQEPRDKSIRIFEELLPKKEAK